MMKGLMKNSSTIALLAGLVAFGSSAHAQGTATADTPAPATPASDTGESGTVGDIIVTAQKRAENVQTVPISITAVSGESLTKSGISGLGGLERIAPGLSISAVGSGFVSYTYIRGGGTNQIDAGSDPSVAYFVDEAYIGGTAGLQFDLFDIDHIEVLKGPQGTLFGRNASSGAISVVTKRPSSTFEGDINLEAGNYGYLLGRASFTGPLTSDGSLKYRVAGVYRRRGAFTDNLAGGLDPGKVDTGGGRAQIEWSHDNLNILLTGDYLRQRNGMTNQFLSTATVVGFVDPTLPVLPNQSFFKHYYSVDGFENQDLYDIGGRIELSTAIGTITSISAYRNNHFRRSQDQDATGYDAYILNSEERDRTFSQELRLTGDTGRLRYTGGLYYYRGRTNTVFNILAGPAFPSAAARNRSALDLSQVITKSYAAYGQLAYDLTDSLNLAVGARYTKDRKSNIKTVRGFLAATPFVVTPSGNFSAFTPSVTLSYKPREGILVYASYRQGFKSGGFQGLLPATPAIALTIFKPEKVNSYELGLKSTFLDRKLLVNLALFRSDITNQQISRVVTGTSTFIDNAGSTRADGIDISLAAKPVPGVTLSADMTYQHAKFRNYQNGAVSYAGNYQLRSPKFTGFYSAEYEFDAGNAGRVTLHGDYSYKSKAFYDAANSSTAGLFQPGYGVANLRASFALRSIPLEIAGFVKNVGNRHYFVNIAIAAASGLAVPGEPRTYGVSLNYHFK